MLGYATEQDNCHPRRSIKSKPFRKWPVLQFSSYHLLYFLLMLRVISGCLVAPVKLRKFFSNHTAHVSYLSGHSDIGTSSRYEHVIRTNRMEISLHVDTEPTTSPLRLHWYVFNWCCLSIVHPETPNHCIDANHWIGVSGTEHYRPKVGYRPESQTNTNRSCWHYYVHVKEHLHA